MNDLQKTILFFDDWLIQEQRGLTRTFHKATPLPDFTPYADDNIDLSFDAPNVLRLADGKYHMWAVGIADLSRGDEGCGIYKYISEDGVHFTPDRDETGSYFVFGGEYSCCGGMVFLDENDPEPARRFKMVYSDLSPDPVKGETCKTAVSPDGRNWTIDHAAIWQDQHTDTCMTIVYNPILKKYQFTSRPILGDRRVALYQTKDFKTYEQPFVLIHPDCQDPPMVEFYGMPIFNYENYFIGFLWRMYGTYTEKTIAPRFKGKVNAELTYSVNGMAYNRTNRESINEIDTLKYRSDYPSSMVVREDGDIYIYSYINEGEHNDSKKKVYQEAGNTSFLNITRLRKDGFVSLDTTTDHGFVTLRPFIYKGGEITLNAVTNRFGSIHAELRSVPDGAPIEGFTLEDSIPFVGDEKGHALRWKNNPDMSILLDEPVRLHLEMDEASLYAVRFEGIYLYGFVPETDLNGSYIKRQLPGLKEHQKKAFAGLDREEPTP